MVFRVLLIDDHELIRQGLRRAFERSDGFEVVAAAGTVTDGLRLAHAMTPDVVVTDVRLPDGSGFDVARRLRQNNDQVGIVVLTMYAGDDTLLAALDSGASAFVSKDAPGADVVSAARHAVASPRSFSARDLVAALQRRKHPTGPRLSEREQEVLVLLSEGLGVAAIADDLYISQSTAKTHISRIYEKLGVTNRAQAIMTAIRTGALSGDTGGTGSGSDMTLSGHMPPPGSAREVS